MKSNEGNERVIKITVMMILVGVMRMVMAIMVKMRMKIRMIVKI